MNLFRHRAVLWDFVARDLRTRYAGTTIGLFWTFCNPLLQIMIYIFVFSSILSGKFDTDKGSFDYWIYLCTGLLPWMVYQEACIRSTSIYLEHANLIKKVLFPAEILPGFLAITGLINLCISMLIFLIMLAVTGHFPGWVILLLPFLIVLQQLATFGMALALSILTVFFRDLAQLAQVFFMVWFWATPICYPVTLIQDAPFLPEWGEKLYAWNPFLCLVSAYRCILMENRLPDWPDVALFAAFALIAYLIGKVLFRTQMKEIVDLV